MIACNHTLPPFKAGEEATDPNYTGRVPTVWNEDHLLKRMWDANGHAAGIPAPGGWTPAKSSAISIAEALLSQRRAVRSVVVLWLITAIQKSEIEELLPSSVSIMPNGLLKPLNQDEVPDLLAYLLSRGDRGNGMFSR